jgi:DNA-binding transcriptional regulator YiaG
MSTFANQLKAEISRLARKEARAEVSALKKLTSQYRSEIATLKKRVSEIETVLKKLGKASLRSNSKAISDAPEKALRFRVAGFAALRKKLGLSAAEMGQLIGVSAQSIYHWESGKTKPRASQLAAISSVRKLGKKEVASRLENSPSN